MFHRRPNRSSCSSQILIEAHNDNILTKIHRMQIINAIVRSVGYSHVFVLKIRSRLTSDSRHKNGGQQRSETAVLVLHGPFHSRCVPALFTVFSESPPFKGPTDRRSGPQSFAWYLGAIFIFLYNSQPIFLIPARTWPATMA